MLFKRPNVSVIMASYNHAGFVEEAVRSVLNQSANNIEIIVVDDGSKDGTADKVEKIRDSRIKLIRLAENRLTHPRNLALSMAKGRYIAFQNSDDVWLPGKLEAQLKKLEADRKLAVSFTAVEIIDLKGNSVSSWLDGRFLTENATSEQWLRRFFDKGNCFCISSAVVRWSSLAKVGFFKPSLFQLADLDLWVRLAAVGNFYIHNKKYTKMRSSRKNLSYPTPETYRRSSLELTEILKRYLEPPVVKLTSNTFQEVLPRDHKSLLTLKVGLAYYCLKRSSPAHRRFADFILAGIIDDPKMRQQATKVFGGEMVNKFIENRASMETIIK